MEQQGHRYAKLIGELAQQVDDFMMEKLTEAGITLAADAINVMSVVSARIASAAMIGSLHIDTLPNDSIYNGLVEAFVALFRGDCESIRAFRLANPHLDTDLLAGTRTPSTPTPASDEPETSAWEA